MISHKIPLYVRNDKKESCRFDPILSFCHFDPDEKHRERNLPIAFTRFLLICCLRGCVRRNDNTFKTIHNSNHSASEDDEADGLA